MEYCCEDFEAVVILKQAQWVEENKLWLTASGWLHECPFCGKELE